MQPLLKQYGRPTLHLEFDSDRGPCMVTTPGAAAVQLKL